MLDFEEAGDGLHQPQVALKLWLQIVWGGEDRTGAGREGGGSTGKGAGGTKEVGGKG